MEAIHFTDAEKSAFRAAYAPAGTTDEQWALFLNECQRRALVLHSSVRLWRIHPKR